MSFTPSYSRYATSKPVEEAVGAVLKEITSAVVTPVQFIDLISTSAATALDPSTASSVTCTLTLGVTITVPAGSLISAGTSTQWALQSAVTSTTAGSYSGTFHCTTLGPVTAASGTLTTIVSAESGWTAVTNASAATAGHQGYADSGNPKTNNDFYIADLIQQLAVKAGI